MSPESTVGLRAQVARGNPGEPGRHGEQGNRGRQGGRDGQGPQAGITLAEIAVGLGMAVIVVLIFQLAYKALTRGSFEVGASTDMQALVKTLGGQIESDIRRAGFGMQGATVFGTMGKHELALSFKDLLGATCAANEVATIRYAQQGKSVLRQVQCGGSANPPKVTGPGRDSLSLVFRYLDNAGKATAASAQVRTVEYTVEIIAKEAANKMAKRRASTGSVSVVNNG